MDAYSALIEAVANDSNESLEGLVKDLVDTVEESRSLILVDTAFRGLCG